MLPGLLLFPTLHQVCDILPLSEGSFPGTRKQIIEERVTTQTALSPFCGGPSTGHAAAPRTVPASVVGPLQGVLQPRGQSLHLWALHRAGCNPCNVTFWKATPYIVAERGGSYLCKSNHYFKTHKMKSLLEKKVCSYVVILHEKYFRIWENSQILQTIKNTA